MIRALLSMCLAFRLLAAVFPLLLPYHIVRRLLWLPDSARNMGIHLMAGRGSGKSRLMGRVIGWRDFVRGTPLVILDPAGPTIDNLLDKILRSPQRQQEQLLSRVVYVDMSGKGTRVVPFPLYYRQDSDESLYEVSQRFLDTVQSADPNLLSASVQGWNALWRIGTFTGMMLAALGYQITEAEDLLANPKAWTTRLQRAFEANPDDLVSAFAFFTTEYPQLDKREREMLTRAFLTKITAFSLDPRLKAMFGASTPGIAWGKVIRKRQAVLLDFRHVTDPQERRFKMLWVFQSFFAFVKHRGAGRHTPISFIVDELANLSHTQVQGESPFAKALDELINVYARNGMVWLTLAHQELFQIEERIQPTLMSLGTQILGVTSDRNAALAMAKQLFPIDPHRVKRYDAVYASFQGVSSVIDERPVNFTPEEQHYLASNVFTDKRLFEFLVRPAAAEGDISQALYHVNIKNFDKGQWVQAQQVAQLRDTLRAQTGVLASDILAEIAQRRDGIITPTPAHANDFPQNRSEADDEENLSDERAW
jgi:hypothetical protein